MCIRDRDVPVLFARGSDPYHHAHSNLLDTYVRLQEAGLLQYRNSLAPEDSFSTSDASAWATANAESVFTDLTPNSVRRKVQNKTKNLRLHPTLVGWYLVRVKLRTGTHVWLAVPPVEFRWGLIGAFHDRLGHAGGNQTLGCVASALPLARREG